MCYLEAHCVSFPQLLLEHKHLQKGTLSYTFVSLQHWTSCLPRGSHLRNLIEQMNGWGMNDRLWHWAVPSPRLSFSICQVRELAYMAFHGPFKPMSHPGLILTKSLEIPLSLITMGHVQRASFGMVYMHHWGIFPAHRLISLSPRFTSCPELHYKSHGSPPSHSPFGIICNHNLCYYRIGTFYWKNAQNMFFCWLRWVMKMEADPFKRFDFLITTFVIWGISKIK